MKRDVEVFCNIFRIVSLKKMEKSEWKLEYEYLIEEGFLDVFSQYERQYLDCYLRANLFDEKIVLPHINGENISKNIKKYFPLSA